MASVHAHFLPVGGLLFVMRISPHPMLTAFLSAPADPLQHVIWDILWTIHQLYNG